MVFGFAECTAVAAYIALVFLPLFPRTRNVEGWKWLRAIMGALLVLTLFYFTHNAIADSWQLITGFALLVSLVVAKKLYCSIRRYTKNTMAHGFLLFLIICHIVGIFVAMCIEPAGDLWPVNVGCFAAWTFLFLVKLGYWYYWNPISIGFAFYVHGHHHHHHHHHGKKHGGEASLRLHL